MQSSHIKDMDVHGQIIAMQDVLPVPDTHKGTDPMFMGHWVLIGCLRRALFELEPIDPIVGMLNWFPQQKATKEKARSVDRGPLIPREIDSQPYPANNSKLGKINP